MSELTRAQRVEKMLRQVFPLAAPAYRPEWTANDIPLWDSMGHLNLVMALNEEFGISIEFDDMLAISAIGDIPNVLGKYLGPEAPAGVA